MASLLGGLFGGPQFNQLPQPVPGFQPLPQQAAPQAQPFQAQRFPQPRFTPQQILPPSAFNPSPQALAQALLGSQLGSQPQKPQAPVGPRGRGSGRARTLGLGGIVGNGVGFNPQNFTRPGFVRNISRLPVRIPI